MRGHDRPRRSNTPATRRQDRNASVALLALVLALVSIPALCAGCDTYAPERAAHGASEQTDDGHDDGRRSRTRGLPHDGTPSR